MKRVWRALLIVVPCAIVACADDPPSTRPAPSAKVSAPPEIGNFPPEQAARSAESEGSDAAPNNQVAGPLGENPAVVFESFQNDVAACTRLIDLMRSDPAFANAVDQAIDGDRGNTLASVLRNARAGSTKEIRHLIDHLDSIRVGHSAGGEPFAAAVLPARGVYCAPSRDRLAAIERLGATPQAWRVREYFLTGALRAVRMPWDPQASGTQSFESLLAEVESAARLYRGSERAALEGWLAGAISHLLREQARIQLADSTEARQQEGVVSAWIAMLEGIRSIRADRTVAALP